MNTSDAPPDSKRARGLKPASFARGTSVMTLGTGISRITGFVRTAALASVLGLTARYMADAFNLANIIPNIIYDLILGGVLSSLFIPIFVEYLRTRDEEEAWHVANSVFNITLVVLTTITVVLCVLAPYIIRAQTFLAHGRTQMVNEATFLLRFFIFEVIFYGVCAIYTGILNSYKHFTIPAFAPIANNIVVIATVVIYNYYPNHYVLAIGATLGVVAMAMIQLPWVRRTGFRYRPVIDLKHPAVRKMGRLAVPVVAFVLIHQVGMWVVNILAAQVPGGISAFQYGYIFFQLPYGIVAVSIITALFPTLSEQHVRDQKDRIIATTSLGVRTTAFVIIPASIGYAILSQPIVHLLLQRLNFSSSDTEMLASVVLYFVLGLFFFSVFMLFLKVFYATQDTKTPMIVAAIITVINIGVDFLYFYSFGTDVMKVSGLALGNTTAYVLGTIGVWIVLRRRLGSLDGRRIAVSLSKICAASAVMAGAIYLTAWGCESLLGTSTFWALLILVSASILVGSAVYLGLAVLLRSEEMAALKRLIVRYLKRNQSDIEPTGREPVEEDSIME
ncbi:MAG: murein biosynthesis integral membrane protein MurJ [Actinobacteria bacterium]|nr:murein biosynthesis integral membrane protein MurJ [Actinomycetota bacterium]MBU1944945.1 murein biosynthesis integral membrane protein MurJ [Actinomycetota bacterium]MBU2688129.1 murein biosynthesis integral membrane protein MurJ [Actinomycetota bacterium]